MIYLNTCNKVQASVARDDRDQTSAKFEHNPCAISTINPMQFLPFNQAYIRSRGWHISTSRGPMSVAPNITAIWLLGV